MQVNLCSIMGSCGLRVYLCSIVRYMSQPLPHVQLHRLGCSPSPALHPYWAHSCCIQVCSDVPPPAPTCGQDLGTLKPF